MCPFCYIGKRKFESALNEFEHADEIEITWKSYQLSPEMETDPSKNIHQYLAEHKGISIEEARELNAYVTNMAAENGLTYNFDKAIPANSFNAHRLLHFALKHGKQNELEELLFRSYFSEGMNTDDLDVLSDLASQVGLDKSAAIVILKSGEHAEDVQRDIEEAYSIGVRGVPFFLFNSRYAVAGAREKELFLKALTQAYSEWKKQDDQS